MQRASEFLNDDQRQQVESAVAAAEKQTVCEIVPVVATTSGRYDRPEDIVGLWLAVVAAATVWLLFPRQPSEPGNWGDAPVYFGLLIMIATVLLAFIAGAIAGSRIGWLRRLFTPRQQMLDEVATRAREIFFDQRVHHTRRASGMIIYVSLFERMAVVLADRLILDKLGQPFLDCLCQQLTDGLHAGNPTDAMCRVIAQAGSDLAEALPGDEADVNELHDALVMID